MLVPAPSRNRAFPQQCQNGMPRRHTGQLPRRDSQLPGFKRFRGVDRLERRTVLNETQRGGKTPIPARGDAACGKSPSYEFTTPTPEVEAGHEVVVEVRLINSSPGTLVSDAVITATRLDMAPDGMDGITSTITPQPSNELGAYRFSANFKMVGRWELSLTAQVPGHPRSVSSGCSPLSS